MAAGLSSAFSPRVLSSFAGGRSLFCWRLKGWIIEPGRASMGHHDVEAVGATCFSFCFDPRIEGAKGIELARVHRGRRIAGFACDLGHLESARAGLDEARGRRVDYPSQRISGGEFCISGQRKL